MLKFKFNYLNQTLAYQKPFDPEHWYQLEESFEGSFGGLVFNLKTGWINFTIYEKQIKVFYKYLPETFDSDFWTEQKVIYFRKYLAKREEVIFEFNSSDQVEKLNGKWVKKNKVLSETKGGSYG